MSIKHSIVKFKFDDFADLTEEREDCVSSDIVTDCNGNSWMLHMYPRGDTNSIDGYVDVTLYNQGSKDIFAGAAFIVRDARGKVYVDQQISVAVFTNGGKSGRGYDVVKRSDILDKAKNILVNGALHVDVHIQIQPDSLIVPPSPLANNMLKLLQDKDSADVQFKVGNSVMSAHKCILKTNAPILYEFSKGGKEGEKIQMKNVNPNIFRFVLRYIYAGAIPNKVTILGIGMGIIDAADRFGIVGLKLAIETELVKNLVISSSNVIDWLIFAESKTCSLLKETAMSYFVVRATDLLNSNTREKLSESPDLMVELMTEMSKRNDIDTRFDEFGNLSVTDLRKKLIEEEMDIDGSKEMLVSRLNESAKKKQRKE